MAPSRVSSRPLSEIRRPLKVGEFVTLDYSDGVGGDVIASITMANDDIAIAAHFDRKFTLLRQPNGGWRVISAGRRSFVNIVLSAFACQSLRERELPREIIPPVVLPKAIDELKGSSHEN